MEATTLTCTRCRRPIDALAGYLVAGDELQFTSLPDPQLEPHEEPMHFVCPTDEAFTVAPIPVDTIADRLAAAEQLIVDALNPNQERPFDATIKRATYEQLAAIEHRIWSGQHTMSEAMAGLAESMINRERHERTCRDCRPEPYAN